MLLRLVHIGSLIVWAGGGGLYGLARRLLRAGAAPAAWTGFEQTWRAWARRSFWLLGASGVYLLLDRLTDTRLDGVYIGVLGIKIACVAAIAWLITARSGQRPGRLLPPGWRDPARWILGLTVGATALGVLLTLLYEGSSGGR
ncbi:MAG: hypothetical protein M3Z04_17590 [Chloroflexota bacterium]|nr:hypothetical protein [Chloroflexota bacterium]